MSRITREYNTEDQAVTFVFGDGEGESRTVSIEDIKPVLVEITLYGISQKLGDSFAGAKGDIQKAMAAFDGTLESLKAGVFNSRRSGGSGSASVLTMAVMEVMGLERDQVEPVLYPEDKDAGKAARKSANADPRVKAVVERIKTERQEARNKAAQAAAANAEGDGQLSGLFG